MCKKCTRVQVQAKMTVTVDVRTNKRTVKETKKVKKVEWSRVDQSRLAAIFDEVKRSVFRFGASRRGGAGWDWTGLDCTRPGADLTRLDLAAPLV